MFITPHFTLQEMTASRVAQAQGMDNTPTAQALVNLRLLCQTLEQVRKWVGAALIINSAFRSPALNLTVGGEPNSAHLLGLAADFTAVGIAPRQLAQRIYDSDILFDQLILEFDSWVHLAVSHAAPRREVLTIRRGGGYLAGIR